MHVTVCGNPFWEAEAGIVCTLPIVQEIHLLTLYVPELTGHT